MAITNKYLHQFFYAKHQELWQGIIDELKSMIDEEFKIYLSEIKELYHHNISLLKEKIKNKLWPHIDIFNTCFGCEFASDNCKKCFLVFQYNCYQANSLWWKLGYTNTIKEAIKYSEEIRDCGYIISPFNRRVMLKLYRSMKDGI